MRTFIQIPILLIFLFMLLGTFSCSKQTPISEDTTAFSSAISTYLKNKSMGMKVADFKTLSINKNEATAKVRLQDAEGITNLKVTWTFKFSKTPDTLWKVDSHLER